MPHSIHDRRKQPAAHRPLRQGAVLMGLLVVGLVCSVNAAEVYKWTDAKGGVHFSDKPPPGNDKSAQTNVSQVRVGTAGPDFRLRRLTPLPDSGGSSRMPLRLSSLKQDVMAADRPDWVAGQSFGGAGCTESEPYALLAQELDFSQPRFMSAAQEGFTAAGWTIADSSAENEGMELNGEISALRLDRCSPPEGQTGGTRVWLRVRWNLIGFNGQSLFRGSSEGSHDGWSGGVETSQGMERALSMAANNLLADSGFVDKVRAQRFSGAAVSASGSAVEANIEWGDSTARFEARTSQIQGAVLLVQAGNTSGSGVIIDLNGWAITSARLVGNQPNVMVLLGQISLPAAVVKRDEVNDVALLRFVRNKFTSVLIAPHASLPGDAVHVVSGPSTPGASNVTLKTSIAAQDLAAGTSRMQLGTTETHSNAGAPVFNQHGELAGLISMDPVHAGKGVEGLRMVPILQALNALNIDLR